MARRLIISMLDLVERPLGKPRWNDTITRLNRPEQTRLEALALDPHDGWKAEKLDLRYPGTSEAMEYGKFVFTGVGDIDGDGQTEIVFAVTPADGDCYVLAYRERNGSWRPEPVYGKFEAVDFIRSMALGDLDGDGCDEIVIGTRPDGVTVLLDRASGSSQYSAETIDAKQQGAGSNVREVAIGDIGGGRPDIFTCSALSNTRPKWDQTADIKWESMPGKTFRHHRTNGGWERTMIEDHGGVTHSRLLRVGELAGAKRLVSCSVGVHHAEPERIDPEPVLRMHTLGADGTVTSETIGVLEKAIMCRSMAIGDIDGDGENELVIGTRSLAFGDHGKTFLYAYKYDAANATWTRTIIDTSEPLGFRSLILADLDGDGRLAVIASDDGKGMIKAYRFRNREWHPEIILSRPNLIFCTSMAVY
jgi:hypothetical protein